jgi:hypothetical protein
VTKTYDAFNAVDSPALNALPSKRLPALHKLDLTSIPSKHRQALHKQSNLFARFVVGCIIAAAPRLCAAQAADVPYVPTPPNVVEAMLDLAKVTANDFLIDLGSGDGRIVIAAAKKYGARGLGVELDGALVSEARREAERQGVGSRVEFRAENLFITDIARATVITTYLFPSVNVELRPRIFAELKPGTRIVSHEFDFGNWQPDARITIAVPNKPYGAPQSDVMLWIVPANAAGRWQWRMALEGTAVVCEATFEQTFQALRGTARVGGMPAEIREPRLRGNEIRFTLVAQLNGKAVRQEFVGRISADAMMGKTRSPRARSEAEWRAERIAYAEINIDAAADAAALAYEP